jgi:hypothetical protein
MGLLIEKKQKHKHQVLTAEKLMTLDPDLNIHLEITETSSSRDWSVKVCCKKGGQHNC